LPAQTSNRGRRYCRFGTGGREQPGSTWSGRWDIIEVRMTKDISHILANWPCEGDRLDARCILGDDGRELLQLRVALGVLQMGFDGRPDGERPFGQSSLLKHLVRLTESNPTARIDAETWTELDREVMQYYHRRQALLIVGARSQAESDSTRAIGYFNGAVRDAEHNLSIMDFIKRHCDDEEYVQGHERYRPYVLMHRTLAEAQIELARHDAEESVERIKAGILQIEAVYKEAGTPELLAQDPSIVQLRALEHQIRKDHNITRTLREQLDAAVENEEFELAVELRDRLRAKQEGRRPPDDA
jgi:hypothetical protein